MEENSWTSNTSECSPDSVRMKLRKHRITRIRYVRMYQTDDSLEIIVICSKKIRLGSFNGT